MVHWSDSLVSCEEGVRGLGAVTQLRDLGLLQISRGFDIASLLRLTSLTALTNLRFIHTHDGSEEVVVNLQVSKGACLAESRFSETALHHSCCVCQVSTCWGCTLTSTFQGGLQQYEHTVSLTCMLGC